MPKALGFIPSFTIAEPSITPVIPPIVKEGMKPNALGIRFHSFLYNWWNDWCYARFSSCGLSVPRHLLCCCALPLRNCWWYRVWYILSTRSEEHTSELQSRGHLVCRLLLEKKKKTTSHAFCMS